MKRNKTTKSKARVVITLEIGETPTEVNVDVGFDPNEAALEGTGVMAMLEEFVGKITKIRDNTNEGDRL